MIGEFTYLMLGTGMGIILAWLSTAVRGAGHAARLERGTTVAEIQARLEREDRYRRAAATGRHCT
ncbi:hypothetical protein [Nocardia sp. IFM 10818]